MTTSRNKPVVLPARQLGYASEAEAETEGLPHSQEPKYTVNGSAIVNRSSGEAVPHDEPVFIIRARDRRALAALEWYAAGLPLGDHRTAVEARISDFELFATNHVDRMKEPDTAAPAPQPEMQAGSPKKSSFQQWAEVIKSLPMDGSAPLESSAAAADGVYTRGDERINAVADGLFDHQRITDKMPPLDRDGFREIIGAAISQWAAGQDQSTRIEEQVDALDRQLPYYVRRVQDFPHHEGMVKLVTDSIIERLAQIRAFAQQLRAATPNMKQDESSAHPVIVSCTCGDDTARRYCLRKRECTRIEPFADQAGETAALVCQHGRIDAPDSAIVGCITVKGRGRPSLDLYDSYVDLTEGRYQLRAARTQDNSHQTQSPG